MAVEVDKGNGAAGQEAADAAIDDTLTFARALDDTLTQIETLQARIAAVEEALPNAAALGEQMVQLAQNLRVAQGQIQWLAQQRAVAEQQLLFQLRSTALDLAIKALPGASDPAMLVPVADALVEWLKAGTATE